MIITRKRAKEIVDYNTTGKGKENPRFTDLANARKWLCWMDKLSVNELNSTKLRLLNL